MKLSRRMISEFIMITLTTITTAAGVFFFLMPSHLAVGSVSGLSIIVGNFGNSVWAHICLTSSEKKAR